MEPAAQRVLDALEFYVGASLARPVMQLSIARSRANMSRLRGDEARRFVQELDVGLRSFLKDQQKRQECLSRISIIVGGAGGGASGSAGADTRTATGAGLGDTGGADPDQAGANGTTRRLRMELRSESDILMARGAGRDICKELGFPPVVQVKVATAISELARNIVQYAGTGTIEIFRLANPPGIEVLAIDEGPGIPNLDSILSGKYRSRSGMGMGIVGTRNLVDEFQIDTAPGKGTRVRIRKFLG